MQYKTFGKTGLKVSALSFGTMTFGGEADATTSIALYKRCREEGINLFDSADYYNEGRAEEILGRLIQEERNELIVTSKVYFPTGSKINDRGLSRKHIIQSVEASLKRLKTDYLDVYFMHRFDDDTPLEESLRAMEDLVISGKVLYLGASNFAAWQIMKGIGISLKSDWSSFQVIQPMYNLLKRQAEVEILPMAQAENLAVISYNPLGGGVLTGKYSSQQLHSGTRLGDKPNYSIRYPLSSLQDVISQYTECAKKWGYSPAALAIAWVSTHPAITSPLLGARNLQQLEDCLQATKIEITPQQMQELSDLTPELPLATNHYSDELPHILK